MTERCADCGVDWPGDAYIGTVLRGNIEIQEVVGAGGMGIVYRGIETHLNRNVAVKMLLNTGILNRRTIDYFMREARVLSQLRHPNLVSVLDFGQEDDGALFLVLEYIPGQTVEDLLEREFPLAHDRVCRIMIQMTSALEEAHRHKIIHRDLKPANIRLEEVAGVSDFVKVLDFGIAKVLPGAGSGMQDGNNTEIGTALGTPRYMSPEQLRGRDLDARSDVYSAALVMYEMLTQTVPNADMSVFKLLLRKGDEPVVAPGLKRPDLRIPNALDRLCMRGLDAEPSGRFQNMAEFRLALEDVLVDLQGVRSRPRRSLRAASEVMDGSFSESDEPLDLNHEVEEFGVGDIPGRPALSARLSDAFQALSRHEAGTSILITGPDGSGKTHAVAHARRLAEAAHVRLFEGHCRLELIDRPFRPLLDILLQMVASAPNDNGVTGDVLRENLLRTGAPDDAVAVLVEQYVSGTADDPWTFFERDDRGLPVGTIRRALHLVSPLDRQLRFAQAFREVAHRAISVGGCAIVIEDVEQSDSCTLASLPALRALAEEASILIIMTAKQPPPVAGHSVHVALGNLTDADADAVWAAAGGAGPLPDQVRQASHGLPFFLSQWAAHPDGQLVDDALQLAESQFGLLERRLQRLLILAAVLGEYFEIPVLAGLFPKAKALAGALREAQESGWVGPTEHETGLWHFKNPILHQAIYQKLPRDDRRRYHTNMLKGLARGRYSTRQDLLTAIHARRSGAAGVATKAASELGDRFTVAGDPAFGAEWYLGALHARRHADKDAEVVHTDVGEDLALKAATALAQSGQPERAQATLRRVDFVGVESRTRASTLLARLHMAADDNDAAARIGLGAMAVAPEDELYAAELWVTLAAALERLGRDSEAEALLLRTWRLLKESQGDLPEDQRPLLWQSWLVQARIDMFAQRFDDADSAMQKAMAQARQAEDQRGMVETAGHLATLMLELDKPDVVIAVCTHLHDDVPLTPRHRVVICRILAEAAARMGDAHSARDWIEEARKTTVDLGWLAGLESLPERPGSGPIPGPHGWLG
jgi:serine/threonine protein kinase